jgi:glyoxylase-like metal-dependent hydrolase (beta-lactamase superfamily II)
LRDRGINPDDIDAVFITHWHRDHFGNLEVFKKAAHLASKDLVKRIGLDGFQGVRNEEEIAEGVKVVLTPGHTIDHASIIVDSIVGGVKARVAIAGDAVVSHSYFQSGQIWQYNADFYSIEVARQSILRLTSLSDIIIPGHGVPFFTFKPKWM